MPDRHEELLSLVLQARNGDKVALNSLCHVLRHEAYSICLTYVRNHEDAEDAAAEAILKVCLSIHKFGWQCKFSSWFYTICANVCIDILRKRRREWLNDHEMRQYLTAQKPESTESGQIDPSILQLRYYHLLLDVLHDHPGYVVARLKYQEGRSWTEIAMITNRSVDSCRSQLRALQFKARQCDADSSD